MHGSHRMTPPKRVSRLMRAGLIATAGMAALGVTTPAVAVTGAVPGLTLSSSPLPDIHIDTTHAFSNASPVRTTDLQVAFEVHQYGDTVGAGVDNRAMASAHNCTGDEHCRSVAFSFQIVTMGGSHLQLHAGNTSRATNVHCTGCESLAGAYQFILDTPRPVVLDAATMARLDQVHAAVDAAVRTESGQTLRTTVDALAQQVVDILKGVGTHAAGPAATRPGYPAARTVPSVTLNHVTDGTPARP